MRDFSKEAFGAYKQNLAGLPSFCRLVMLEVFEYYDHENGSISINSLEKLALERFYVESVTGRQTENINGNNIRNAFRSIRKAKPDHFKFTNVNQRIVIEMPFLRELYEAFHGKTQEVDTVLATDVTEQETITQTGDKGCFDSLLATDVAGDLAEASSESAINARVIDKKNKLKETNITDKSNFKAGIADDFTPSQSLINTALARGLSKVTDFAEIKKFVLYNQAKCTKWVDYEPIFLAWLERDAERERAALSRAAQIQNQQKTKKGSPYERHHYQATNHRDQTGLDVVREYQSCFPVSGGAEACHKNDGLGEQHQLVVGSNVSHLWKTFSVDSGCP